MANHFPNYAGAKDIDDALAAELEAAGIDAQRYPFLKNGKSEVDTSVVGELHGWGFKRAWYYWIAEGPGIELTAAEALHLKHGHEVRVEGHCGCPSPREWRKGLAIGSYHVDTPDGLKALADTIRSLVERGAEVPKASPATTADIAALRADISRLTAHVMLLPKTAGGEISIDELAEGALIIMAREREAPLSFPDQFTDHVADQMRRGARAAVEMILRQVGYLPGNPEIRDLRILAEVVNEALEEGSIRPGFGLLMAAALARVFPDHKQTAERCESCSPAEQAGCEYCPTDGQFAEAEQALRGWVLINAPHLASEQV